LKDKDNKDKIDRTHEQRYQKNYIDRILPMIENYHRKRFSFVKISLLEKNDDNLESGTIIKDATQEQILAERNEILK
jgi:hypothetical protein